MSLLDSNILIYSFQKAYKHLKNLVLDPSNAVSEMSRLEVLGFQGITEDERLYLESVFTILTHLPIDAEVISKAIELRKQHKIKSADSIIAATALVHDLELLTRNTEDFDKIEGLSVRNPVDES